MKALDHIQIVATWIMKNGVEVSRKEKFLKQNAQVFMAEHCLFYNLMQAMCVC